MDPEALKIIFYSVNNTISTIVIPVVGSVMLGYVFVFKLLPSWIKKNGLIRGIYLWFMALIPALVWVGLFWPGIALVTDLIALRWRIPEYVPSILRWLMIWVTFYFLAYSMTKKHGEKRGIKSMTFHLATFLLGWIFGKWFGIFLISLPILVVYYISIYHLADGIIPASNPENRNEKWQRFKVMGWYTWGLQYPIQVAYDNNAPERNAEARIDGTPFNSFCHPGLIWLKSHQAAALTTGINFSRVEGPRVIFTKPFERLLEVVDLRTQKRAGTINAVSKDGVRFKAIVFASFALDRENWSPAIYNQLYHKDSALIHARKPDANVDGIYPFSRPRIQAAMKLRGRTSAVPEKQEYVFWDERVFNQVEVVTSNVLSERKFDELWRPIQDGPGRSALDEIADQIKGRLALDLLSQGVRLFAARVVGFDFSEYNIAIDKTEDGKMESKRQEAKETQSRETGDKNPDKSRDEVIKQQIKSWRVDWESQRKQIIADADAEANRLQQAARAHVQSVLLTAIAEGLEQTRIRYPNLPRHVVAMHFVGALEKITNREDQPENEDDDGAPTSARYNARWLMDRRDR